MRKQLLTHKQYGKLRGISRQRVGQLIKAGRIPLTRGRIDPLVADEMLEATAPPTMNPRNGNSSPAMEEYRKQMTRRASAGAHLLELEAAERAGKLCDRAETVEQWNTQLTRLRDRMLALPRHMAPLVLGSRTPAEVEATLMEYIRAALDDLADGNTGIPEPNAR